MSHSEEMAYRFRFPSVHVKRPHFRLVCGIGALLGLALIVAWCQAQQAVRETAEWQRAQLAELAHSYAGKLPKILTSRGAQQTDLDWGLLVPRVLAIHLVDRTGAVVVKASQIGMEFVPSSVAKLGLTGEPSASRVDYRPAFRVLGVGFNEKPRLIEVSEPIGPRAKLGRIFIWQLPADDAQTRRDAFVKSFTIDGLIICASIAVLSLIRVRKAELIASEPEEEAPKEGTEAFFHAAIDAIPLPIVVRDRNDDVVLGNKSWAELPPSAPNATSHTAYIKHPEGALDFTAYARLDRSVSISDVHGAERHFTEHTGRFTGPAAETFKVSVLFDVTDISREKERTETQLRLICDLVEALPLPLYAHDLNGRYIIINRAAENFFYLDREEILGKTITELQPSSLAQLHRSTDSDVLQAGSAVSYVTPFVNSERTLSDVIWTKSAFRTSEGAIAGIVGSVADTTERKRIERRLHLQYETARILTDAISVTEACTRIMAVVGSNLNYAIGTFWEVNVQRDCLECTQSWRREDQHSPPMFVPQRNLRAARGAGLPGRVWATGIPQRGADSPSETGGGQMSSGFAFPAKVGNRILGVMHFSGGRTEDADGDVLAMLEATGNQIGQFMQHQRVQQDLRTSEAAARKLSLVASHTLNAVVITDTDGCIEWVNDAFTSMTGHALSEAIGLRLDEMLRCPETDPTTSALIRQRMDERKGVTAELISYRKSSEAYWVSIEVQPVFSDEYLLTNFIAIATEITERRLGEAALVESNIRLNLALDGANLALWDWHIPSNKFYLSDMWSLMLGGPKTDTVTTLEELRTLFCAEEIPELRAKLIATLKGEAPLFNAVARVRGNDGQWRWIQCHGKVVDRDADGRAVRLSGINSDITDRHNQEAALRVSEGRYDAAVNGSNDGIWDLNLADQSLYISPRFAQLFDLSHDDAASVLERWHSLFHPEDRPLEEEAMRHHLSHNLPYDAEYRMAIAGANFRWFRVRGKALYDGDGHPYRIAGSVTDTTDYRLAREQLQETRDRLDSILKSAEHMIWSRSTDLSALIYVNSAVRSIYRLEPEEFYQNPARWLEMIHPDDKAAVLGAMSSILSKGSVEMEFRIIHDDGSIAWISDRMRVARNALGEAIRIDAITSDITELKSREIELRSAKEAAEAATRAKSEFLANMSHEIRTPMNGIIGIADLLSTGRLSAEQREYIQMVRSSANALLELINDILDFSKIEAGMLHFEHCDFLLRQTLADSLKLLAVRAEEKNLELISRVDPAVPDVLIGDPLRLRQVVTNLLSNAVKFTKQGEVELCVGLEQSSSHEIKLLFAIRDTGIGIPENKIESVFAPFSQADMSTTRKYGGSGLGLTICDRLVKLMRGTISVRSAVGVGTTFYFSAWFQIADRNNIQAHVGIDLGRSRILVCDDNPTQLIALSELFSSWEMECQTTSDLSHALNALDSAVETGAPFDIALFDSRLTGDDGRKLVQKVRARAALQKLPIILLTPVRHIRSTARGQYADRCTRVAKPWSHDELQEAIALALGRGGPTRLQPVSMPKSQHQLSILLAEDNEINIRFARGVLENLGHEVTVARDGLEAVQAVGSGALFDLVLMDVQMPVMSGLEATGAIRALERSTQRRLPIIAMTANAMRGDRERCIESGMDDYISKPVAVSRLVEAIERAAPNVSAPLRSPGAKPRTRKKGRKRLNDPNQTRLPYDREAILEALSHDHAAYSELLQMFLVDHKQMLEAAKRALVAGDFVTLTSIAHTVKGMVGNFAASEASEAAQGFYLAAERGLAQKAEKALHRTQTKLLALAEALVMDPLLVNGADL